MSLPMTSYQYLRSKGAEINRLLDSLPILRTICDASFFEKIDQQIDEMEKKKISGPIHSMFLFMLHSGERGYSELRLLEDYLRKIFSRPSVPKRRKTHIARELAVDGHLFRLFEISVIGNLLSQLPTEKVEPYPLTIGKKRADVAVTLVDRPIFIEATVLGESDADRTERESVMYTKQHSWGGSRDIDKDTNRFAAKILEKAEQFLPRTPSVLIIQLFDFWPTSFEIGRAIQQNQFPNVGLVMLFDRERMTRKFQESCDPTCALRDDEVAALENLLSEPAFRPLVFGSVTNYPAYDPHLS